MAINPNNGVLDIINGTLKVSSIDIKQAAGFTTALNTVARNDVLLFDDQKATTVFTPTSEGGYMSSTGVSRDTTGGAGYIDLNDGWVYWPLQLPNSWHTEFDMHVTTTGGVLTFSLFNTYEPNHTDYTNNDGGYKIVFDNTNNQIDIYWEGSIHKTVGANLRSSDWQHVNINYFQGAISVSLAGKVVLTHEFTQNYQEFNSRYVGFSATTGASHKIRHLRVHNSDKWLYTKTSNASDITYVSGNVGIGTLEPTELLDVHGNVHIARDLTVDGNLTVSGTTTFIDTANMSIEDPIIELARGNASDTIDAGLVITRATSNVAVAYRGDEGELAIGYTQSGASDADVVPVSDGGLDVRVYGNLFANNLTTTANVEATYFKGNGSELTHVTLDQVVGYGNVTSNTIQLAGLTATGNVEANYFIGNGSKLTGLVTDLQSVTDNGNTTSNTVQFTNATTALIADSNVGIGTSIPSANLHVVGHQYVNDPPTLANSFDHSDAPLTLTHGTPTSTTAVDDPKAVLHLTRDGTSGESYGARASFNLSRYENSGTASRTRLDVALTDGTYAETDVMSIRADGKVGIGTDTPAYTLDVAGDINLSGDFYQGGSPFVSSLWTDGTDSLYYRSNVEVGTANLFVDTMTGNVGVGTNSPGFSLDVHGTANVGALTATSISGPLSGNADTATALETARTIGGVSFDGSGNIDLPGVNTTGNQNTSGNAATATALETARTIGGVSFDGTANIDLPGVNTVGTQNTSGNADTATTATNQSGGTVNATTGTFSGDVEVTGELTTKSNVFLGVMNSFGSEGTLEFGRADGFDRVHNIKVYNSSTQADNYMKFQIHAGGGSGGTVTDNVLYLRGDGNVGIGTDSPAFKLDVHGTSNVGALTATTGTFSDTVTADTFSGNATTATQLATARAINGVDFDGSAAISVNGLNYDVNDAWLRENGDNAHFRQYGNSRQMVFRTDGTTQYATGVGEYPFVWMYGGDASGNRRMFLNTSGQLWCSNYGWLHDKFMARTQVFSDTNSNASFTGQNIDFNSSGSQANTGNRTHRAFLIDYDSSASGGTATSGQRNYHYAMHSDMRHGGTGNQYVFYNHYLYTRSDHTSGTCRYMRGIDNIIVSSGTGLNTEIWGINTYVLKDGGSTGATTNMFGIKSEVEVDAGTVTNAYSYHAHIDRDGGTLTNGYLYYGSYAGTVGTKWGIYLTGETKNYFSGNVGIGVTSPGAKLDIAATSAYAPAIRIGTNTTYDDGQLYSLAFGGSTLMGMGLYSSTRTVFGSQGLGIHIPNTEEFSIRSNSWAKLFALDGATNKAYFGGNVGIGTTSPGYKLDVAGTLHAANSYFDTVHIGGSTSRGLRSVTGNYGTVQTTGEGAGGWEGYSINGRFVFMSADNNRCGIYNDLDNEWMIYCYRNSYVKLYFNGGTKLETISGGVKIHGSLTATGNVTAYSDIRHKKDIVKLDNALEKVEKLNGYTYTRKDDDKRYTGLIAQEVLEVLPEAVIADEKGDYSLAYGNMAGLFVEAMKEMKSKLDTALTRLDALENIHK